MPELEIEIEISKSVDLLRKGKVLLYPTDTVWGIGCDATNNKAVQKVYQIKERSKNKSMILLLDDIDKLKQYMEKVPGVAYDLIQNALSPLTIVYSRAKNLPKRLIADDGSIAIRIVKGDYCSEVIKQLGKPLVSTSANLSGQPTPSTFEQIEDSLKQMVDYVVAVHRTQIRSVKPSTLIKLEENGTFKILRA